jgi:hypothetical protein
MPKSARRASASRSVRSKSSPVIPQRVSMYALSSPSPALGAKTGSSSTPVVVVVVVRLVHEILQFRRSGEDPPRCRSRQGERVPKSSPVIPQRVSMYALSSPSPALGAKTGSSSTPWRRRKQGGRDRQGSPGARGRQCERRGGGGARFGAAARSHERGGPRRRRRRSPTRCGALEIIPGDPAARVPKSARRASASRWPEIAAAAAETRLGSGVPRGTSRVSRRQKGHQACHARAAAPMAAVVGRLSP